MSDVTHALIVGPEPPGRVIKLRRELDTAAWHALAYAAGIESPAVTPLGAVVMWACGDGTGDFNVAATLLARRFGPELDVHGTVLFTGYGTSGLTEDQSLYLAEAILEVADEIGAAAGPAGGCDD